MALIAGRVPPEMRAWLAAPRYEVIPTKTTREKVLDVVPKTIPITVTASPVKGLTPTIELAETLSGEGYHAIPHIAARLLRDETHLKEVTERLVAAGITEIFVPAGDANPPAGQWDGALPALVELTAMGSPFAQVGITGYPESHPSIDDDITVQAMWDKRSHATTIVSNLCFDAKAVSAWVKRVRRRGVDLPIKVGVAGPIDKTKLLSMAGKVGVGESTRFLTKHTGWFARLAVPGYSPEGFIAGVARSVGAPEHRVAGLHIFTFNQVAETEAWRQRLLAS